MKKIFFIASLMVVHGISFAQCANAPDLVIVNAHIITMDPAKPEATSMAIRNGIIQSIGEMQDMIALIPEGCPVQWMDAGGNTVLPGFNDSHSHWLSWREHICDAPGQEEITYPELDVIMDSISKNGWTSISELNFGRPSLIPEHLQNALNLETNGDLHVRLNGYWGTYDNTNLLDELEDHGYEPGHSFSERIRAPGVKMYVDDPFGTMDIMDQATCTQLVSAAHNAGYQVAAHCVNQSAVEKIVTAYEAALGSSNNSGIRHRIEHAVKVSDNQLNRIENKGIVLSFQLFGPPDWPEQNTFQTYISNSNTDFVLRWKDFVNSSAPVTGSTDAPFNNTVCNYSPFRALYQAVTRIGYLDRMHAPWELDQRISIAEALKLLTVDGAWATGEENIKGSLTEGKYADLTIVTEDPLAVQTPEELLDIHSLLTMVGGETEYCKDGFSFLCDLPFAFRIDTMMVLVSNFQENHKPADAFDMNEESSWVSGDYAPQYITLDLLKNTSLDRIELVVDQFPSGFTRHRVYGGQDGQSWNMDQLHEFAGNTEPYQILAYNFSEPNNNLRYVGVESVESPSWIAWREIRLFRSGSTSIEEISDVNHVPLKIFPNPFKNELTIELNLEHDLDDVEISMMTIDEKLFIKTSVGHLSIGEHEVKMDFPVFGHPAPGIILIMVKSKQMISVSRIVSL